jgi:hypothetical protein
MMASCQANREPLALMVSAQSTFTGWVVVTVKLGLAATDAAFSCADPADIARLRAKVAGIQFGDFIVVWLPEIASQFTELHKGWLRSACCNKLLSTARPLTSSQWGCHPFPTMAAAITAVNEHG